MENKVITLASFKKLSENDLSKVIGGRTKTKHPIRDFFQGFLDAF